MFKGSKLNLKGEKLLTLREYRTYLRQFISIVLSESVSTTVEVRTQWMWRFSTETIVSTNSSSSCFNSNSSALWFLFCQSYSRCVRTELICISSFSIMSLELVSTKLEVRTQSMWRFSSKTKHSSSSRSNSNSSGLQGTTYYEDFFPYRTLPFFCVGFYLLPYGSVGCMVSRMECWYLQVAVEC
jgi:hypothetical protein